MYAEETTLGQTSCLSGFFWVAALVSVMAILVSACGGGGGGGGGVGDGTDTPPSEDTSTSLPENENMVETPPEEPPQPSFETQAETIASRYRDRGEFSSQWGLGRTRTDRAYAHLELALESGFSAGKGVTIGIVDTGIDLNHPAFVTTANDPDKDRTITRTLLPGARIEDGSEISHGTLVAGVAAGGRNVGFPGSTHGVAWNANLAVFAVPLGTGDGIYRPVDLSNFSPQNQSGMNQWFSRPIAAGVDILNLSLSLTGMIESYSESTLRTALGNMIQTMAQPGVADKTILVWGASNSHGDTCLPGATAPECKLDSNGDLKVDATSPSILAGLPAKISELRGHVVAVVSIGEDGEISHFSNRCGIAAEWCLAAPGESILAPHFGPRSETDPTMVRNYRRFNGTSVAAPMVSGGLALMKQLFRDQLSNTALVSRLLATADKSGRYTNRSIYGQGLMDLGAATAPVGQTTLALGSRVGDPGESLLASNVVLGNAFGDGLTQSLAGTEIAAFDSLGAPFWYDLGSFAIATDRLSIGRRLKNFMALAPARPEIGGYRTAFAPSFAKASPDRWRLGLLETPMGIQTGHLGLARYANTFTYEGWKDLGGHRVFDGRVLLAGSSLGSGAVLAAVRSMGRFACRLADGTKEPARKFGERCFWQPVYRFRVHRVQRGHLGRRVAPRRERRGRLRDRKAAQRIDYGCLSGRHGRVRAPCDAAILRQQAVSVFRVAAVASRKGPCHAVGARRPHQGRRCHAPVGRSGYCADRQAD